MFYLGFVMIDDSYQSDMCNYFRIIYVLKMEKGIISSSIQVELLDNLLLDKYVNARDQIEKYHS